MEKISQGHDPVGVKTAGNYASVHKHRGVVSESIAEQWRIFIYGRHGQVRPIKVLAPLQKDLVSQSLPATASYRYPLVGEFLA